MVGAGMISVIFIREVMILWTVTAMTLWMNDASMC